MTEMTLSALQASVEVFIQERDWRKYHKPKDLAMAISIEAAELQELLLWKEIDESDFDPGEIERIGEEISDVVIFCLVFANQLGLDLGQAILDKMAKNALKYPKQGSV